MTTDKRLGLGLIGCGSFGLFCLEAFSRMAQVRVAAVADVASRAADVAAKRFGVPGHHDPSQLVARGDVHIVHVATPPGSHYDLATSALKAGKHCLCEKPLALKADQAAQMLALARQEQLICPVNFVLRYNAVTEAVKAVIASGVLGQVLAGRLTNCASDASLGPEHWFWDKSVSGGIFVEHGVHFFDLYRYWLGPGEVVGARAERRQDTGQEDRVTCLVRHESGALVSHYHGFDQAAVMDRTDHRLVCEMGDVVVNGWIPLSLSVDALVDTEGAAELDRCVQGCSLRIVEILEPSGGSAVSRGKQRAFTRRIRLDYCPQPDKQTAYADGVRALLVDQVAFIRDAGHARRVVEDNGWDSLEMAQAADRLATEAGRRRSRPQG